MGSRYAPPVIGQRIIDLPNTSPNEGFAASGGNLNDSPGEGVTLTTLNTIIGPANDPLKLQVHFTTSSGLFTGSFFDGTTHVMNGVVFQKENQALGLFVGSTETGSVEMGQ
jgi:hypothetical protein